MEMAIDVNMGIETTATEATITIKDMDTVEDMYTMVTMTIDTIKDTEAIKITDRGYGYGGHHH